MIAPVYGPEVYARWDENYGWVAIDNKEFCRCLRDTVDTIARFYEGDTEMVHVYGPIGDRRWTGLRAHMARVAADRTIEEPF